MRESRSTVIILAVCAIAWAAIVLRNSVLVVGDDVHERTVSQTQINSFAREQLSQLQSRSFADRAEYCGIISENSDGELVTQEVIRGHEAQCDISYFSLRNKLPVANFHTHGAYDTRYDGEVPSLQDFQSDVASGMHGYVSTPGGRLWHIDGPARTAKQLCGQGCLPVDPAYVPCPGDAPEQQYSLTTLGQRQNSPSARC